MPSCSPIKNPCAGLQTSEDKMLYVEKKVSELGKRNVLTNVTQRQFQFLRRRM